MRRIFELNSKLQKKKTSLFGSSENFKEEKIQTISLDRMSIYAYGTLYKNLTFVQRLDIHWSLFVSDLIVAMILTERFIKKRYLIIHKTEKDSGEIISKININKVRIIKDLLIAAVIVGGTIILKKRFGRIAFASIKKIGSWLSLNLPINILKKTFNLFKKILYKIIVKPTKILFNLILLPFKIVFKFILKFISFPFTILFKIIKNYLFQKEKENILKGEDLTVKKIQEYIKKYKGVDDDLPVADIISIINTRLKLERGYMKQIKICLALLRALHEEDITWDQFMKYILLYGTDELYAFMDFIRRGGRSLFSSKKKYPEDLPPVSDLYREPENAIHRRFIQPFSRKPPTLRPLREPSFPRFEPVPEPKPMEDLRKAYEDIIINQKLKPLPKHLRLVENFVKPISAAFGAYVLANFIASPKTQKEFNWILKNFNADPGLKPVNA